MKNLRLFAIALFSATLITSCQPENKETPKPASTTQTDQSGTTEVDAAMEDVNDVISNGIGGGSSKQLKMAAGAAYNLPCGVVKIDTTTNAQGGKTYSVQYGDKTPCGYKYKSGTVALGLSSGKLFSNIGSVYTVTFTNYEVEVKANGTTIKLNGTLNVTNVNGGYIWQTVTDDATIVHKVNGTINITYSNGEVRARNYFHKRTWDATKDNWASIKLKIEGDTGDRISETGKTLDGNYDFTTQLLTPFVWENCGTSLLGPYKLTQGDAKLNVTIPAISPTYVTITGGYKWDLANISSTPVVASTLCDANAYKITTVIGTSTSTSYQLY